MFLGYSNWTWLWIGIASIVSFLIYLFVTGWEPGGKKLPRYIMKPSRTNIKGKFVHTDSGIEKIDRKKGYNQKLGLLYLVGRRYPLPGVFFPDANKMMKLFSEATIFPTNMAAAMMGDPRGNIMVYHSPNVREIVVDGQHGYELIKRNFIQASQQGFAQDLDSIETNEALMNSKRSDFEKSSKEIQKTKEWANAFAPIGTIFSSLSQQGQKGKKGE